MDMHVKMNANWALYKTCMCILVTGLLALPLVSAGKGPKKKRLYRRYASADGRFFYNLRLFTDSTFLYEQGFKLGDKYVSGNWKMEGNKLHLQDQKMPWSIAAVEEAHVDSLNGKTVIRVGTVAAGSEMVKDFGVRVNSDCSKTVFTNNEGTADFEVAHARKIFVDYAEPYTVKDSANNYFLLKMDVYPIYTSPMPGTWKEWVVTKHTANPVECGKALQFVTLKRK